MDSNINKYLIPKSVTKENKREAYFNFYKENIELNNSLIRDIAEVTNEIEDYLSKRIEESEAAFEVEVEEDV